MRSPQPLRLRRLILDYLADHPGSARTDIANGIGEPPRSVHRAIKRMEQKGLVVGRMQNPGQEYYSVYNKRLYSLAE